MIRLSGDKTVILKKLVNIIIEMYEDEDWQGYRGYYKDVPVEYFGDTAEEVELELPLALVEYETYLKKKHQIMVENDSFLC